MAEPIDTKSITITTVPGGFRCERTYDAGARTTRLLFTFAIDVPDQSLQVRAFENFPRYMAEVRMNLDEAVQRWQRENA